MDTLEAIFTAFGGPSKIGQVLGISTEHAAAMKRRRSIPVGYWPALITAARERRITGITYESLTHMHADRQRAGAA